VILVDDSAGTRSNIRPLSRITTALIDYHFYIMIYALMLS
jgi:hypothetical protein